MRSVLFLLAASAAVQAQNFDVPSLVPPPGEELPALPTLTKRREWDEPCAEVAELWYAQKAENAASIRVPAELAWNCLRTVPVDVEGDLLEIEELKAHLEWQSTLSYLKSGVEGQIEPLDIFGHLDTLSTAIKNGSITNDYAVQFLIRSLLESSGDFHLTFFTDLTQIFEFARLGGAVVSFSEDGVSLPKIYLESDIRLQRSSNFKASPVVSINGQDAEKYLEKLSSGLNYHDTDARYNNMFSNPALSALYGRYVGGQFGSSYVYDGPSTVYTFANGTSTTLDNAAFIGTRHDFSTVKDGPSFFQQFCTGPKSSTDSKRAVASSATVSPTAVATRTAAATPTLSGYPEPVFVQSSKRFSGYYLNGSDYSDVAVLAVPAFDPSNSSASNANAAGLVETQQLLRAFFADATKKGKKKLVIDLRGNGGGTIDMGFEFFLQLFPSIEPYGAARYRAHDAFHYFSAIVADLAVEGVNADGITTDDWDDADFGIRSPFLWSNILNVDGEHYKSYAEYYGPHTIHNDTFSSIRRYNFSDNEGGHTQLVSLSGFNEQPSSPQPFLAENVVILQDGFCGSTCAIFSELMREQAHVQTIAVGGRPQNAPMQGVGGSKGSQLLPFDTLWFFAQRTLKTAEALDGPEIMAKLNQTNVGAIYNAHQMYKRSAFKDSQTSLWGGVNSLNNLRKGDDTDTPLEFIYEAADCRLFYTLATYVDPVALWKRAVDSKWSNGACVSGSTGHATAIGVVNGDKTFDGKKKSAQSTQDLEQVDKQGAASGNGVSVLAVSFGAAVVAAMMW